MSAWDKVLGFFGTSRTRLRWLRSGALSARQGRTVQPGRPIVTGLIGAACIGLYLLEILVSRQLGDDRGMAPSNLALVRLGAAFSPLVHMGEWWRATTAIFLHGSVIHILMNGLGLWTVGTVSEERFGPAQTFFTFVLAGTIGEAASCIWHPSVLSVGASGGIFGLIALCTVNAVRRRDAELKARFIPWLGYGLILGFAVQGVDNVAHLGGIVTGAALGLVVGDAGSRRVLPSWGWTALAIAAAVAVAVAFVFASRSDLAEALLQER
jgi:membrane associated rhomboid family serine protease